MPNTPEARARARQMGAGESSRGPIPHWKLRHFYVSPTRTKSGEPCARCQKPINDRIHIRPGNERELQAALRAATQGHTRSLASRKREAA